jgi:hypothetical protein
MKNIIIPLILFPAFSLLFICCSASTTGRYDKKEDKKEKKEVQAKEENKENFDITPYRATFNVEEKKRASKSFEQPDVWYNYETKSANDTSAQQIVSQVNGYRVQVFSTDNLEEADSLRSKLYLQTNQKAVYITFEPPFYKVKVGDFLKISEANDLSFKLNQIGYTEARVVNDKINIYSK